jgi:pimeloyl-ACP methyl ester carboxylesterase
MGPDDALEYFFTEAIQLPPPAVAAMKSDPQWQQLRRTAHTLVYDNEIMWPYEQREPLPPAWADEVAELPTLVMHGGDSPVWMRNAAGALAELLPNARLVSFDGCTHVAPPERVAAVLIDFFGEDR